MQGCCEKTDREARRQSPLLERVERNRSMVGNVNAVIRQISDKLSGPPALTGESGVCDGKPPTMSNVLDEANMGLEHALKMLDEINCRL